MESPVRYQLTVGWNYGAWSLQFSAANPFAKTRWSFKSFQDSKYFTSKNISYSDDLYNKLSLSVSYSFNYGKKVDRDELNGRIERTSLRNSMDL